MDNLISHNSINDLQDNTLDSRVHWRTRLMERYLKLKDPFAPNIPDKFNIPHYLTAPFRIRDKDRWAGLK